MSVIVVPSIFYMLDLHIFCEILSKQNANILKVKKLQVLLTVTKNFLSVCITVYRKRSKCQNK